MINKTNVSFLTAYIELDKACCRRFGIQSGGVSMYINKLVQERFAPEREEILPRLIRYRNARNKLAHEDGALKGYTEIEKSDIKWISSFTKTVSKKKDPISLYEGKADRYVRGKKVVNVFKIVLLTLLAIAAVIALKYFGII